MLVFCVFCLLWLCVFFFSSRRRHTRCGRDWSSDVCSSDLAVLRKKGQAAAAKKATREATEGLVGCYIHAGGKIGVLVEINCESDFVARTEAFQQLTHDIAMHIAALDPRYVRREEVTQDMLDKEREIYKAQALA